MAPHLCINEHLMILELLDSFFLHFLVLCFKLVLDLLNHSHIHNKHYTLIGHANRGHVSPLVTPGEDVRVPKVPALSVLDDGGHTCLLGVLQQLLVVDVVVQI